MKKLLVILLLLFPFHGAWIAKADTVRENLEGIKRVGEGLSEGLSYKIEGIKNSILDYDLDNILIAIFQILTIFFICVLAAIPTLTIYFVARILIGSWLDDVGVLAKLAFISLGAYFLIAIVDYAKIKGYFPWMPFH